MELDEISEILANAEFFSICDDEQRRLLAFASERRQFEAGDQIFVSGDVADGAYIIMSGRVSISDDPDRPTKTYNVSGPHTMIGEMGLILDRPRKIGVKAAAKVDTLFIPRSAFAKLMRQFPDLAERAATRIGDELQAYLGKLDRFRSPSIPE